jgi:hypothetical protein
VKGGHTFQTCKVDECEECQRLVNDGFVMACDECDQPGYQDADGWVMNESGIFCSINCAEKLSAPISDSEVKHAK